MLVFKAAVFAEEAHRGQKRKLSGADYIVHPARVAGRIAQLGYEADMIAAGWLHDTIEDCYEVTFTDIENTFGHSVGALVFNLTNIYTSDNYPKMNRAARKKKEFERISHLCNRAKIIKLVDRIDNLMDVPGDDGFMEIYLKESKVLLDVLRGSHADLEAELAELIYEKEHWFANLSDEEQVKQLCCRPDGGRDGSGMKM